MARNTDLPYGVNFGAGAVSRDAAPLDVDRRAVLAVMILNLEFRILASSCVILL